MNKPRVLGIGIATMDIYCHHRRMYPGGNEYNIAYNAKLQGAEAGFMGVFANDHVGEILERTLTEAGVDTSYSHHEQGSSGYALVDIRDGDRVFLDWNKEGVTDLYPFTFTDEELAYIRTFDVACTSWGGRVSKEKVRYLSENGITICYDFYDCFTAEDIEALAPWIAYGFFSCSHISEEETKAVLRKSVELGAKIAVGTRGNQPALAFDGTSFYEQPILAVKPVDTMGAGDSYISAFLVNYLSPAADESLAGPNKIHSSLKRSAEYAATVVMKDGSLGVGYDVDPDRLSEIINL